MCKAPSLAHLRNATSEYDGQPETARSLHHSSSNGNTSRDSLSSQATRAFLDHRGDKVLSSQATRALAECRIQRVGVQSKDRRVSGTSSTRSSEGSEVSLKTGLASTVRPPQVGGVSGQALAPQLPQLSAVMEGALVVPVVPRPPATDAVSGRAPARAGMLRWQPLQEDVVPGFETAEEKRIEPTQEATLTKADGSGSSSSNPTLISRSSVRSSHVGVSDLTQSDVESVCSSRRGATPTRFDRSRLLSRSGSAVALSGKSSRASRSTSDLGQKIDTSLLSPTKSVARFEQFSARQRVLGSPATMTRSTRPSQMPTVEIQDTVEIAQALRLSTSEGSEALVYEPIHAVDHVASTTWAEGTSLLSTQLHVAADSPSSVLEVKAHVPEVPCSHSTREPELVCDHDFAVSSRLELLATPREGSGPAYGHPVESCCQTTPPEVTTPSKSGGALEIEENEVTQTKVAAISRPRSTSQKPLHKQVGAASRRGLTPRPLNRSSLSSTGSATTLSKLPVRLCQRTTSELPQKPESSATVSSKKSGSRSSQLPAQGVNGLGSAVVSNKSSVRCPAFQGTETPTHESGIGSPLMTTRSSARFSQMSPENVNIKDKVKPVESLPVRTPRSSTSSLKPVKPLEIQEPLETEEVLTEVEDVQQVPVCQPSGVEDISTLSLHVPGGPCAGAPEPEVVYDAFLDVRSQAEVPSSHTSLEPEVVCDSVADVARSQLGATPPACEPAGEPVHESCSQIALSGTTTPSTCAGAVKLEDGIHSCSTLQAEETCSRPLSFEGLELSGDSSIQSQGLENVEVHLDDIADLVRFQEAALTLDDTAPEDPEMSRLLDGLFTQLVPDVSAMAGLDSFQDLRPTGSLTAGSPFMKLSPRAHDASEQHGAEDEDGTSDSLALDARSLLYGVTGASQVHGEPNILGIDARSLMYGVTGVGVVHSPTAPLILDSGPFEGGPFWNKRDARMIIAKEGCEEELIMTGDLNSLAKRGIEASVTAPMPVPQSNLKAKGSAIVKHCIDLLAQALEVPADAEVPDSELATVCFETREQRLVWRDILNEAVSQHGVKALYSLFDVESSPGGYPRPPPSTTGSHGIASAVVSHERIVAPSGAGLIIMPNLGDGVGPSASFQPSLPLPVRGDCDETVSIMSTPRTSPNRYPPSTRSSPAPRSVFAISLSESEEEQTSVDDRRATPSDWRFSAPCTGPKPACSGPLCAPAG